MIVTKITASAHKSRIYLKFGSLTREVAMRRIVGLILIGIGAFLLALAPLSRFYVAHQVVAAPMNVYETTTLQADNATYLDVPHWTIRKGATVTAKNTTRGDVHASDGKIAVWDSFTSIEDPSLNARVEIQAQRAVFNRRTGELQNGRGASVGNDSNVKQSGVGLYWPIPTKKQTYPYFDTTTKRTWPMVYQGEEKIHGVTTYRFVQQVPPTVTDSIKPGVPAALFGLNKAEVSRFPGYDKVNNLVPVDRAYSATTTVWVDPRTGAPISQEQKVRQTMRTTDGVDRLVIADLDLKMTDASQKKLADKSQTGATEIAAAKTYIPFYGGALGLILIIVGALIALSGRRRPAHRGAGSGSSSTAGEPAVSEEPSGS
jgi:hypothetical protein